jgi:hypothetical protein
MLWYGLIKHGDTMEDAYIYFNIAPSFGPTVAEDLGNLSESIRMALADGIIVLSPLFFPMLDADEGSCLCT